MMVRIRIVLPGVSGVEPTREELNTKRTQGRKGGLKRGKRCTRCGQEGHRSQTCGKRHGTHPETTPPK
jgi:hypothetical protein